MTAHDDTGDGRSMRERMLAGEPYRADDPELVAGRQRCARLLASYDTLLADGPARVALLRELLGAVGEACEIMPPLRCDYGVNIHLGDRVFVNYGAVILDVAPVRIGNDCQLATNVQLLTATHPLDARERSSGWESGLPITLGDDVWLGGGVLVLPGVTIGDRAVVGAGAVVTKDVAPDTVVVGNPARVVRHLDPPGTAG